MKSHIESYSFTGLDGANQDVIALERIDEDIHVSILIDGMGEYKDSGDIANLISKTILSELKANIGIDYNELLVNAIESANREVKKYLYQHKCKAGATLAIFVQHEAKAHISWLGDVRVYSLRDGELTLLTDDHKVDTHLVIRSINGKVFAQVPPYKTFNITPEDQFILCSDGVYNILTNEEIISLRDNMENYNNMQFIDDASIIYISYI